MEDELSEEIYNRSNGASGGGIDHQLRTCS
jgi:hypothetical protein